MQAAAKERGALWVKAFKTDGKFDDGIIQNELNQRTYGGKPVTAFVAAGPAQAMQILRQVVAKEKPKENVEDYIRKARECLWDYHLIALHECQHIRTPEDAHPFMKGQPSMLDAFSAGLGYIIAMGELIIGIVLPESHRDEDGNLHNETGFALGWTDGTKEYRWHGIEIPEAWIETPNDVDVRKEFRDRSNAELRRTMSEVFGWDRVTRALGVKELQRDDYGALIECDVEGDGSPPWRMVDVKCPSTDRRYVIPVPPEIQTCRGGLAWSANVPEDQYELAIET